MTGGGTMGFGAERSERRRRDRQAPVPAGRAGSRRAVLASLTAAAFVTVAAAFAGSASAQAPSVKLGVSGPFSGPDAVYGDQIRLGVEQAVSDVNAAGGLLGRKIRIVPGDDGGDPKKGAEVAKAFVDGHVPFVIGPFSSAVAVPASTLYAAAGVLEVSPGATAPSFTDRSLPTVFRVGGREDAAAGVAARWLLDHHVAKIAIAHDRTGAGMAFADAVRRILAAAGTREVFYGTLEKGTRDAAPLAGRVKASSAAVVVWGGAATEGGLLVRQLRDANARTVLLGDAGIASEDFASVAGPAADGSLIVFARDPRRMPAAVDLLKRFRARGVEPGAYTFYAYAAVEVIQQAAAASRSLDGKALAATMRAGVPFHTVLGELTFDAHGDPTTPDDVVYVWHRGASGRMTFDDPAT